MMIFNRRKEKTDRFSQGRSSQIEPFRYCISEVKNEKIDRKLQYFSGTIKSKRCNANSLRAKFIIRAAILIELSKLLDCSQDAEDYMRTVNIKLQNKNIPILITELHNILQINSSINVSKFNNDFIKTIDFMKVIKCKPSIKNVRYIIDFKNHNMLDVLKVIIDKLIPCDLNSRLRIKMLASLKKGNDYSNFINIILPKIQNLVKSVKNAKYSNLCDLFYSIHKSYKLKLKIDWVLQAKKDDINLKMFKEMEL